MMKKTFTKLFVAFLALLLAPNSLWAFEINSETTDAACKTQFGNSTSLNTSGTTAVLSFGESYNGTTLDLVINSALDIQIAEGLTVNLQSLTCNAPVTVYGGGTLNITNDLGYAVRINGGGSLTIGKNGQEAPMDVSITSGTELESGDCCIYFDDDIYNYSETIVFKVIGSNVTLSGNLTNGPLIYIDEDEEYPVVSYEDSDIEITSTTSATITPTTNSGSANLSVSGTAIDVSADVADVLNDGKVSYTASTKTLTLADGTTLTSIVNNSVDGLIIDVLGAVTITPTDEDSPAIKSEENLTIKSSNGNGNITMTSSYVQNGGGTINVVNSDYDSKTLTIESLSATITNTALGGNGINVEGSLNIDNASTIDITAGANAFAVSVMKNDETDLNSVPQNATGKTATSENNEIEVAWVEAENLFDLSGYYNGAIAAYTLHIGPAAATPLQVGETLTKTVDITGDLAGTLDLTFTVTKAATDSENGEVALYKNSDITTATSAEDMLTAVYLTDNGVCFSNPSDELLLWGNLAIPETVQDDAGKTYNVTAIGAGAFKDCDYINGVQIPATVTMIGLHAFQVVNTFGGLTASPTITFEGDFISDTYSETTLNAFDGVEGTLAYPANNDTWSNVATDWNGGTWIVPVEDYHILITKAKGDYLTRITQDNQDDILGDGTMSYDPDNKILTLNAGTSIYDITNGSPLSPDEEDVNGVSDLTINVAGAATVTSMNFGTSTKITGTGLLSLTGDHDEGSVELTSNCTLTIENANISISGDDVDSGIIGDNMGYVVIKNSNITLDLKDLSYAAYSYDKPFVNLAAEPTYIGCAITYPVTAPTWGEDEYGTKYYVDGDNNPVRKIVIEPILVKYGIAIAKTADYYGVLDENDNLSAIEVTSANAADVLGDGKVSYNAETNTLTLADGAALQAIQTDYEDNNGNIVESTDGLTIIVAGNVTMTKDNNTVYSPFAFDLRKNTTISGTGTLTIDDIYSNYGILFCENLLIQDVTITIVADNSGMTGIQGIEQSKTQLKFNHATYDYTCMDVDYFTPIYQTDSPAPVLLNCAITTPAEDIEWNGDYFDLDGLDPIPGQFVISPTTSSSALTATIEDGSADDVTIDLKLTANNVVIQGIHGSETAIGSIVVPNAITVGNEVLTVTAIGDGAFEGQTNLTGATLPKTVTSIGENAFAGCTNMTSLTVQSPFAPTVGEGAFTGTSANLTVNYPAAAYAIYNEAGWTGVATFQPTVMQPNEWSTICSTQDYEVPEGLEAYIVVGIDYENCAVKVKKMDYILADTPMMLRKIGAAEDYPVHSLSMIIYQPDGEQLPKVIGDEDAFIGYAPVSANATPMELPESSGNNNMQAYILIGNSFVRWTSGTLAPYRCFLWATQAFNTGTAPQMGIEIVDGETTGVGDVRGKKDDVRGEWYDLSGRKLQGKPTQKGVYIINGKKVNVK